MKKVKLSELGEIVGGSTPATKNIENYDGKIVITTSKGFLLLLYINDYNVQRLELLGNVNLPIIKIFYKKGKLNAITSGSKLILRFN